MLIDAEAKVNQADQNGYTALHWAAAVRASVLCSVPIALS